MKRESVSGLKHADAPFLYFFSRLASLLLSASIACSMLRDGGGKSFSNKKCEKRAGAGERQGAAIAPFPKSCASYFRFARFNTFPLYYLRAWHRLVLPGTGFTDTLKSFLRKNSFLTPNERPKSNSFIVNVICDWPTKTCRAAVVGITVYNSRKLCGTLPAWFALTNQSNT